MSEYDPRRRRRGDRRRLTVDRDRLRRSGAGAQIASVRPPVTVRGGSRGRPGLGVRRVEIETVSDVIAAARHLPRGGIILTVAHADRVWRQVGASDGNRRACGGRRSQQRDAGVRAEIERRRADCAGARYGQLNRQVGGGGSRLGLQGGDRNAANRDRDSR